MNNDRPAFQQRIETQRLIAKLKTVAIGEMVTYEDLTAIAGVDVQKMRQPLRTARRALLVQERIVFGTVTNEGVKRLDDVGKINAADNQRDQIRRKARNARRTATALEDYESLPSSEKLRHAALVTYLVMTDRSGSKRATKLLEVAINANGGIALPFQAGARALAEFTRKTK